MVEIGGPYVDKMRCRQDSLYAIHKTILILTLKDIRFSHMMDLCQGIGSTVSKVSSCQHSVANHLFGRSSCFHSQGDKIATLQPTHREQTDSIGCSRCWLWPSCDKVLARFYRWRRDRARLAGSDASKKRLCWNLKPFKSAVQVASYQSRTGSIWTTSLKIKSLFHRYWKQLTKGIPKIALKMVHSLYIFWRVYFSTWNEDRPPKCWACCVRLPSRKQWRWAEGLPRVLRLHRNKKTVGSWRNSWLLPPKHPILELPYLESNPNCGSISIF